VTSPQAAAGTSPAAAFLLPSGAATLIFETLWVKQLSWVVGVEVHAVSIALSAFFAGLGIGGAFLGRRADRTQRPLRLYAIVEVCAGVVGVVSTLALARSAPLFVALQDTAGALAWLVPCALVAAPACFMGGTLPLLVRACHPDNRSIAAASGSLYAANTLGAVGGTLVTPFLLIPALGVTGTGLCAGAIQIAVAAAAWALDRRDAPATSRRSLRSGDDARRPRSERSAHATDTRLPGARDRDANDARLALALYAVAGGVALGYEVVWSELLVQFLSTRSYAFAVMLATYLGGLALGSFLFVRRRPAREPWRVFGLLIAGAGTTAVVIVALLGGWLSDAQIFAGMWAMRATGSETLELSARFAVAAVAVLLVPTMLLGAAFPAVSRLTSGAGRVGRDIGATIAMNTAGGIAGTLLTGFVFVPSLGLVRTLGALAIGGAVLGVIAVLKGGQGRMDARILAGAILLAVVTIVALTPRDKLADLLVEKHGGKLVFYDENTAGTVAVLEQQTPAGPFKRLYIQGVSNSGDALSSQRYMRLQALLPLLIHGGQPRSALVLGLGTGITAGALLGDPALDRRVVAELLPAVVRAAPLFAGNMDAGADPRLTIRVGDGRHELLRRAERYDLITLEPPPPSAAGVVNLYSRDFYELCRDRLLPGGLMAQWWPLATQNEEDSRALVRSFLDAFPFATLWSTELHEMLLVGSTSPIRLDAAQIDTRFSRTETAAALRTVGVKSAAALLATWITDRSGLERYAGDAAAVTDDRPRIEHAAWVRRGEFQRVLPRVLALATDVPIGGDERFKSAVDAERGALLAFYRAALQAYDGDRKAAAATLGEVLKRDPENPYYRWILPGVTPPRPPASF
jgi:spermidine synthase